MDAIVYPVKDPDSEFPIATQWRPVLCELANKIIRDDFSFEPLGVVDDITDEDADYIRENILDYGEPLALLPEETWET